MEGDDKRGMEGMGGPVGGFGVGLGRWVGDITLWKRLGV